MPGRNLKECIDNWNKIKLTPQVSANIVGAAEIQRNFHSSGETPEDAKEGDMTVRQQEELQVLENLLTSTQKKIDNAKRKYGANKQDKEGLTTRAKAYQAPQEKIPVPNQPIEKSLRPDPQF
jgi:hypothetical protein